MGWFVIACMLGYLGYWGWRFISDRRPLAAFLFVVGSFVVVFVSLVLWARLSEDAESFGEIADTLHDGRVARFLLGIVLGAGVALTMAGSAGVQADDKDAPANSAPAPLPAHLVLSLGLGILLLALTAPYVDGWFRRVTGFKSSVIELQLAGAATHRISIAEGQETLILEHSLEYLEGYASKIETDIEYYEKYGQDDPKQPNIIASARELLPTFKRIAAPVAGCVDMAIKDGWLSIDSARELIRPTTDLLEQILFDGPQSRQLDEKQKEFWNSIADLPKKIRKGANPQAILSDPVCSDVPKMYWEESVSDRETLSPKFGHFKNVPYLYVTAAWLISFMNDRDKALRVLQNAQPMLDYEDFNFQYTSALLSYYQGKPGDLSKLYLGHLDDLRKNSLERIRRLEAGKQKCESPTSLPCRERIYELVGTNMAAYFLAEDLARDSVYVKPHVAQLQEFAEEIKHVVGELDAHKLPSNGFDWYVQRNKETFLDTYAYATLVVEAQKPNLDCDLIRKEVVRRLERVVENIGNKTASQTQIDKIDLSDFRAARAHLEAAQSVGCD
jgi:hypothetical protein